MALGNKLIGRETERELVRILRKLGFSAVRIPTSNSSSNPLPDVFATYQNILLSIEVKTTKTDRVKVNDFQVKKVFEFASMFPTMRSYPLIVVKFRPGNWRAYRLEEVRSVMVTTKNSVGLTKYLTGLLGIVE